MGQTSENERVAFNLEMVAGTDPRHKALSTVQLEALRALLQLAATGRRS